MTPGAAQLAHAPGAFIRPGQGRDFLRRVAAKLFGLRTEEFGDQPRAITTLYVGSSVAVISAFHGLEPTAESKTCRTKSLTNLT